MPNYIFNYQIINEQIALFAGFSGNNTAEFIDIKKANTLIFSHEVTIYVRHLSQYIKYKTTVRYSSFKSPTAFSCTFLQSYNSEVFWEIISELITQSQLIVI